MALTAAKRAVARRERTDKGRDAARGGEVGRKEAGTAGGAGAERFPRV